MSIEAQFDRELNVNADTTYRDLTPEEREAVVTACNRLIESNGSEVVRSVGVVLGLLQKTYSAELFESRLGMDPAKAHAKDEAVRARCAAALDAIDLTTNADALLAVVNNIYKE